MIMIHADDYDDEYGSETENRIRGCSYIRITE
jgi:hypothetical protein